MAFGSGPRALLQAAPARPSPSPRARPSCGSVGPPAGSRPARGPTTPRWRLRPGSACGGSSGLPPCLSAQLSPGSQAF
eukprot:5977862-Lingulodinium_polyedra.AAC.1